MLLSELAARGGENGSQVRQALLVLLVAGAWQACPDVRALADRDIEAPGRDVIEGVLLAQDPQGNRILGGGGEVGQGEYGLVGIEEALEDLVAPGGARPERAADLHFDARV